MNSRLSLTFIFFAIFGMVILSSSCDNITSPKPRGKASYFFLNVVNGSGVCDSAHYTISKIIFHARSDARHPWRHWLEDTLVFRFDNTSQINIDKDTLSELLVEHNSYDSLSFYLHSVSTWSNGVMKMPLNALIQTGLKLDLGVEYALVYQYLILDLNAPLSMRKAGWNPNTIYDIDVSRFRFLRTDHTGAIEGAIINHGALPVCYAIRGNDTLSAVMANRQTGSFSLGYLPPGSYSIGIVDTLNRSYKRDNVTVLVGSSIKIGTVPLQ